MNQTKRKLNWKPDRPDFRDWKYGAHMEMKVPMVSYPAIADIETKMPPVFNQLDIGSCTSQGVGAGVDYLQMLDIRDKLVGKPEEFDPKVYTPVSRLFIYAVERMIEGTPLSEDSGAQIRDGIKAVRSYGVCRETLWPYTEANAFVKPHDECFTEAAHHKMLYAYRVDNSPGVNQILRSIIHGYPVVFGMSVYESFMSNHVANTGIVPMPKPYESIVGGHCMDIVGYNLKNRTYRVRNSWGLEWGMSGHCDIPMDMLENQDIASDMWTLRRSP